MSKICVESKYQYQETAPHQFKHLTRVIMRYWPDGDIKRLWEIAGPMFKGYFKDLAHVYPDNKVNDEHLIISKEIFHDMLKNTTPDEAARKLEAKFRTVLELGVVKVERYLERNGPLVSHLKHLKFRVDKLEKLFNEHTSRHGKNPHGVKKGKGRNTWIKYS